jgi:hypothetical protein
MKYVSDLPCQCATLLYTARVPEWTSLALSFALLLLPALSAFVSGLFLK